MSFKARDPIPGSEAQITKDRSWRESSTEKANLFGLTKPTIRENTSQVTCMGKVSCKQ